MTNARMLCFRNEMANLEHCLSAVADRIACRVIGNTSWSDFVGPDCPWHEA
jgi:hypothetical protein